MKGPFLLRTGAGGRSLEEWGLAYREQRCEEALGRKRVARGHCSAPQQHWADQPSESLGKCGGRKWAAPARDHSPMLGSVVMDGALAQQASAWGVSGPRCPKRVRGGPSRPHVAQGASEVANLHPVRADMTWGTTKSCLGPGK